MRTTQTCLALAPTLLLLAIPFASADPTTVPVPGPGEAGTPPFHDVPQACDPLPVVCVGPVHVPIPIVVTVEAHGFELAVDPEGTPGMTVGPVWQNVTVPVLDVVVPIVLCPVGCNLPATPTQDIEGTIIVTIQGLVECEADVLGPAPSIFPQEWVPCFGLARDVARNAVDSVLPPPLNECDSGLAYICTIPPEEGNFGVGLEIHVPNLTVWL